MGSSDAFKRSLAFIHSLWSFLFRRARLFALTVAHRVKSGCQSLQFLGSFLPMVSNNRISRSRSSGICWCVAIKNEENARTSSARVFCLNLMQSKKTDLVSYRCALLTFLQTKKEHKGCDSENTVNTEWCSATTRLASMPSVFTRVPTNLFRCEKHCANIFRLHNLREGLLCGKERNLLHLLYMNTTANTTHNTLPLRTMPAKY